MVQMGREQKQKNFIKIRQIEEKTAEGVVVVIDLSRYSYIIRHIEKGLKLGTLGSKILNQQIQELVRRAISRMNGNFEESYVKARFPHYDVEEIHNSFIAVLTD